MSEDSKSAALEKTDKEQHEIVYTAMGGKEIKLTIKLVKDQLAHKTKSGKAPTNKDVVKYMMLCQAQELDPWQDDVFLIGFDGKNGPEFNLVVAIKALEKRAQQDVQFDGCRFGPIVMRDGKVVEQEGAFTLRGDELLGGWAEVYRKDRKYPEVKKVNLGPMAKGFGYWKVDPVTMIAKCAKAGALRSAFPTTVGDLYLRAEREALAQATGGMKDITADVKEGKVNPLFGGNVDIEDVEPEPPEELPPHEDGPEEPETAEESPETAEPPKSALKGGEINL